jgi:TolA-binding protein/TM2 domain-containing membrane protein YozV
MKFRLTILQTTHCFLLILFFYSIGWATERGVLLTEEVQLKVADAFLEEKEFYRAVTEYKKFLILFPESRQTDYVFWRLGQAYYQGSEYDQAIISFGNLRDRYGRSFYTPNAIYYEGLSYWKLKNYNKARSSLEALVREFPDSEAVPESLIASSLVSLDEEDIPASKKSLARFIQGYPGHIKAEPAQEALRLLDQYQDRPQKSPAFAGVLSAVLPGAGYFYAEHYADGFTALLVNALFIAGTITALHQENYALAAIVGGVGLPFYFGNIYGAANAAKKWNLGVRKDLRDKIYLTLDFAF